MAIRVGIDVACRTAHRAACADASGQLLWRNVRYQTNAEDLEELWRRLPDGEKVITVVMEPTRNAWVPLAAWFRRHGAKVIMVPLEQSADLRAYYRTKPVSTSRVCVLAPTLCCGMCVIGGALRTAGTGLAIQSSTRMHTATAGATACR
jgi:hypothetical protein